MGVVICIVLRPYSFASRNRTNEKMASITDVQFEHYQPSNTLGVHETKPQVSWRFLNAPSGFQQAGYEIELSKEDI